MLPVSFSVIPAVLKPESSPAPNEGLRMMDSGYNLAGMTACEFSDSLLGGPRISQATHIPHTHSHLLTVKILE